MSSFTKIAVAQLGARQDYTVPLAIQNLSYLEKFYTDIYVHNREAKLLSYLRRFNLKDNSLSKFLSRQNTALSPSKINRFNWLGLRYTLDLQRANTLEKKYQLYIDYGQKFNHAILQHGLPKVTHVYAFDHAALELFREAKADGVLCILDQIYAGPIHDQIAEEETRQWGDWERHPTDLSFYTSTIFRDWCAIQQEEWTLADRIIVASCYTYKSIIKLQPSLHSKIQIVPLTVNISLYLPYQHVRYFSADRPLRVLFVGRASILKGIQYLLRAFEEIPERIAQLTVVGSIYLNPHQVKAYDDKINFEGPVPYVEIPRTYHDYDVLVFPTISDGFGAVMLEAMATGLPVIATENCGDIIEDGVNGYRIPIRNSTIIVEKIMELVKHPELLTQLSVGAIATSRLYTLEHYQAQLSHALDVSYDS